MNKNSLCNNCGKHGHLYSTCKLPIISYGIILFRQSNKGLQYLMIRRKDSFGYIDIIRGKYTPHNIPQIQRSIDEMSMEEKQRLINEPYENLWKMLWGDNGIQHRGEGSSLAKKFEALKNELKNELVKNELKNELDLESTTSTISVNLEYLIQNSKTEWQETEWEFPKGHRNFQEKDVETALREFEEETGYSKDNITIIDNIIPYEEIFIGSNHKSYKHKYYVAYLNTDTDTLQNYQKSEVSKIEWKTIDECLSSIRPYNLEKKNIIKNVNQVLLNYILSY
jgi:8-oxo-dGTP pyrophosphatase MutT (NUDIX family)